MGHCIINEGNAREECISNILHLGILQFYAQEAITSTASIKKFITVLTDIFK
jgi:hypothetical protein